MINWCTRERLGCFCAQRQPATVCGSGVTSRQSFMPICRYRR